jgi:hypothetical protein
MQKKILGMCLSYLYVVLVGADEEDLVALAGLADAPRVLALNKSSRSEVWIQIDAGSLGCTMAATKAGTKQP